MHRLSSEPYLNSRFDTIVNVIGNSHFHFPILDLLGSFGGAAISHDNRMLEAYRYDRGNAWTADCYPAAAQKFGPRRSTISSWTSIAFRPRATTS